MHAPLHDLSPSREETNPACPGSFSLAEVPTSVSLVRLPAQLKEAALPLALSLPVPLNATAKPIVTGRRVRTSGSGGGGSSLRGQQARSYASSLSAALLPHLIQRPTRLVAALDALWPLVLTGGFNGFILYGACHDWGPKGEERDKAKTRSHAHARHTHTHTHTSAHTHTHTHTLKRTHTALKRYPELVAALDRMSLTGVAVGLGLVHLSLGVTFHALVTNKVGHA